MLEELGEFFLGKHLQILLSDFGQIDSTGQVFALAPLTIEPREEANNYEFRNGPQVYRLRKGISS